MRPRELNKYRNFIILVSFFSFFTYFGCKPDVKNAIKYVPIVYKTVCKFVGKTNQVSATEAKAEIELGLKEVEKIFAASGVGSLSRSMEDLERSFEKAANKRFMTYYSGFLTFFTIGEDPKISMEKYLAQNQNGHHGFDLDTSTSILTFPVIDTFEGEKTVVNAKINLRDVFEKQKVVKDIEKIRHIEMVKAPVEPPAVARIVEKVKTEKPKIDPTPEKVIGKKIEDKRERAEETISPPMPPNRRKRYRDIERYFSIGIRNFLINNPGYRVVRKDIAIKINGTVKYSSVELNGNREDYIEFSVPISEGIMDVTVRTTTFVEYFDDNCRCTHNVTIEGYRGGRLPYGSGCYDVLTDYDPYHGSFSNRKVEVVDCR